MSGTPRTDGLRARVPLVALWAHECLDFAEKIERELIEATHGLAMSARVIIAKDKERTADVAELATLHARIEALETALRASDNIIRARHNEILRSVHRAGAEGLWQQIKKNDEALMAHSRVWCHATGGLEVPT
jgi:hypothetical protein